MFYNVENLFDTINDPDTRDEQFLPDGAYNWTSSRYYWKLQRTAKVLLNAGEWDLPVAVGLCEIENRGVLEDLLRLTPLGRLGYGIIHEESPDERGIDVALLYREDLLTPIYHRAIPLRFDFDRDDRTRDMLYVAGRLGPDTLHLMINHWPSRSGGAAASEPKRIAAAQAARHLMDSLQQVQPGAKVILMGDFNDGPTDTSVRDILRAASTEQDAQETGLFNCMAPLARKGFGTHKYQQEWNTLDQFMVSLSLLEANSGWSVDETSAIICRMPFLLEDDPSLPGDRPFRTFIGPRFHGGYSDHLPILLTLHYNPLQ